MIQKGHNRPVLGSNALGDTISNMANSTGTHGAEGACSDSESTAASSLPQDGRCSPPVASFWLDGAPDSAVKKGQTSSASPHGNLNARRKRLSTVGTRRSEKFCDEETWIDAVTPKNCKSERELSKEMDSAIQALKDTKGDWNVRINALQKLRSLAGGNAANMECFAGLCMKARDGLVAHVQDLRSAVAREACAVCLALSQVLQSAFEPIAVVVLPALFKNCSVSIQVIAEPAFQSIWVIVRQCRTPRVLNKILDEFQSKTGARRTASSQALLLALEVYEVKLLEKQVDQLEQAIKQSLEDAIADVRAFGRRCFWAFHEVFQERGGRLFARLDSAKQRLLEVEKPKAPCDFGSDDEPDIEVAEELEKVEPAVEEAQEADLPPPLKRLPPRSANFPPKPEGQPGALPHQTPPSKSFALEEQKSSIPEASQPCEAPVPPVGLSSTILQTKLAEVALSPTRIPRPSLVSNFTSKSFPHRKEHEPEDSWSSIEARIGIVTPQELTEPLSETKTLHSGGAFMVHVTEEPRPCTEAFLDVSRTSSAACEQMSCPLGGEVFSTHSTAAMVPSIVLSANAVPPLTQKNAGDSQVSQKFTPPPRVSGKVPGGSMHTPKRQASGQARSAVQAIPASRQVAREVGEPPEKRLEKLLFYLQNTQPSVRVAACDGIAQMFAAEAGDGSAFLGKGASLLASRVVNALLARLGDESPDVIVAALKAFREIAKERPSWCESHLERLLLKLLQKQGEAVVEIREAAKACLQACVESTPFATIFGHLSRLYEHPQEVPKLGILDVLISMPLHESPACRKYFAGEAGNIGPMRGFLERLVDSSRPSTSTAGKRPLNSSGCPSTRLRRRISECIHSLFLLDAKAFLAAVTSTDATTQSSLCSIVADRIPELSEALAAGGELSSRLQESAQARTDEETVVCGARAGAAIGTEQAAESNDSQSSFERLQNADVPAMTKPFVVDSAHGAMTHFKSNHKLSDILASGAKIGQEGMLRMLAAAAETETTQQWERHFGRALIQALDALAVKDPLDSTENKVVDAALQCLQKLLQNQASFFDDFAEVVASKLFDAHRLFGEVENSVTASIDRTLGHLIGIVQPARAFEILLPVVNAEKAPLLQGAVRHLAMVIRRMPPAQLLGHLDAVLPGVINALGDASVDVRKGAVFALVDVYLVLGERVMPHLVRELTPSQMKLVTIYIGRAQRESEESGQVVFSASLGN